MEYNSRNLHLVVEDLGLAALGRGNQVLVKNVQNVLADLGKLVLNLLAVLLDEGDLGLVALRLLFLLDGGDDSPGRTAGTDDVLVGNRQEIPLFNSELYIGGGDNLHVLDHFCMSIPSISKTYIRMHNLQRRRRTLVALSLLGELGQVNSIFVTHFEVIYSKKTRDDVSKLPLRCKCCGCVLGVETRDLWMISQQSGGSK